MSLRLVLAVWVALLLTGNIAQGAFPSICRAPRGSSSSKSLSSDAVVSGTGGSERKSSEEQAWLEKAEVHRVERKPAEKSADSEVEKERILADDVDVNTNGEIDEEGIEEEEDSVLERASASLTRTPIVGNFFTCPKSQIETWADYFQYVSNTWHRCDALCRKPSSITDATRVAYLDLDTNALALRNFIAPKSSSQLSTKTDLWFNPFSANSGAPLSPISATFTDIDAKVEANLKANLRKVTYQEVAEVASFYGGNQTIFVVLVADPLTCPTHCDRALASFSILMDVIKPLLAPTLTTVHLVVQTSTSMLEVIPRIKVINGSHPFAQISSASIAAPFSSWSSKVFLDLLIHHGVFGNLAEVLRLPTAIFRSSRSGGRSTGSADGTSVDVVDMHLATDDGKEKQTEREVGDAFEAVESTAAATKDDSNNKENDGDRAEEVIHLLEPGAITTPLSMVEDGDRAKDLLSGGAAAKLVFAKSVRLALYKAYKKAEEWDQTVPDRRGEGSGGFTSLLNIIRKRVAYVINICISVLHNLLGREGMLNSPADDLGKKSKQEDLVSAVIPEAESTTESRLQEIKENSSSFFSTTVAYSGQQDCWFSVTWLEFAFLGMIVWVIVGVTSLFSLV